MIRFFLWVLINLVSINVLAKPLNLVMWHSLAGSLGEQTRQIVKAFNKSQSDYTIKLIYKGEYTDSLTSFAAAFRAGQAPAIIQIFEVGTAVMLMPRGVIKPLAEILKENNETLHQSSFLPAILNFYSKAHELQAMPFNTSVPVIFYNADILAKVGIHKAKDFPKTWQQLETVAHTLKKRGFPCAYTSAYPSWIHIESFAALHGLALVDHRETHALYNSGILHHLERLKKWDTLHYFEYGGRASDATVLFTSGRCAMFSQSSGSYNSLASLVNFHLNVAPQPLDTEVSKIRHNNVIGGAALWAVAGQTQETYRGILRFYQYLSSVSVQQVWYQNTGYLPLGLENDYAVLAKNPNQSILDIARFDLSEKTARSYNLCSIPQNQIRIINDEALEAIFSGIKSPKEAMENAILRTNFALLRFVRNTGNLNVSR